MNTVYESERLQLKVFSKEDCESAKAFWGNGEVMKYCGGPAPHRLLGKTLETYQRCHEEKGLSVYAVVEKDSGKIMGAAGFNVHETIEKIELIFHFSKDSWGNGYASEAAKGCIELARKNSEVNKIFASTASENISSAKVLEKTGFQYIKKKWFDDTNQEECCYEYPIK